MCTRIISLTSCAHGTHLLFNDVEQEVGLATAAKQLAERQLRIERLQLLQELSWRLTRDAAVTNIDVHT